MPTPEEIEAQRLADEAAEATRVAEEARLAEEAKLAAAKPPVVPKPGDPPIVPPEPEPAKPPKAQDWRDNRIAQLTSKLRATEGDLATVRSQLAQGGGETDEAFELRVQQAAQGRAQALAAEQKFNDDSLAVVIEARKQFPDFDQKMGGFGQLVDLRTPEGAMAYRQFISTALETGNAGPVLYALAGDLDEAARVMGLSPTKQAMEMVKLAVKPPIDPLTKAPKPIVPISRRTESHDEIDPGDAARADQLSTAEWMKRRNAQVAEQQKDLRRGRN